MRTPGTSTYRHRKSRPAFTLVELLVVIGIIAVLMSILIPVLGRARDQANKVQCANNLRQLVLAMVAYSSDDRTGSFPRTKYDPTKKQLQLDNAGYGVADTFGNSGYVGENNVPASLYLLMRATETPTKMFVCPSGTASPGPKLEDIPKNSNWDNYTDHVGYSLAAPFPKATPGGGGDPFLWQHTMASDFAILADINPGTRGKGTVPNNVIGPKHDATPAAMAAANSNNHANKGQNVAYADAHVEWQTTPYCGRMRDGGFRDHIYAAGTGDNGICDDTAMPVDAKDSVLLPTDDPGGK